MIPQSDTPLSLYLEPAPDAAATPSVHHTPTHFWKRHQMTSCLSTRCNEWEMLWPSQCQSHDIFWLYLIVFICSIASIVWWWVDGFPWNLERHWWSSSFTLAPATDQSFIFSVKYLSLLDVPFYFSFLKVYIKIKVCESLLLSSSFCLDTLYFVHDAQKFGHRLNWLIKLKLIDFCCIK